MHIHTISPQITGRKYFSEPSKRKNHFNAFQSELSFKSSARAAVKSIEPHINIGSSTLQTYIRKLNHFSSADLPELTLLYSGKEGSQVFLLFKKALPLGQALDVLSSRLKPIKGAIEAIETKMQKHTEFPYVLFEAHNLFKLALEAMPGFTTMPTKGLFGNGNSSLIFSIPNNRVLKLSKGPNFPSEAHFIEGVDIPTYGRHLVKVGGQKTYGVIQAFAESAEVRLDASNPKDWKEFQRLWETLCNKIQKKGAYKFSGDFKKDDPASLRQLAFVGDDAYVIDFHVIELLQKSWGEQFYKERPSVRI